MPGSAGNENDESSGTRFFSAQYAGIYSEQSHGQEARQKNGALIPN